MRPLQSAARGTVLVAALVSMALMLGCAEVPRTDAQESVGDDSDTSMSEAVVPSDPDLTSPERAIHSYLDWVTLSYRLVNSDVPTMTMTPEEWVRVDAYIEFNRQQDRGIEQALIAFDLRGTDTLEPTATLTAREEWRYRYFSLSGLHYLTEPLMATYDTTYTVVQQSDGFWRVDSVAATALTEVP